MTALEDFLDNTYGNPNPEATDVEVAAAVTAHEVDAAAHTGTFVPAGAWRTPTGVLGESIPRWAVNILTVAPLASGRQSFIGVWLPAGTVVTNISALSGTTAAATPTNQWFSLYSDAFAKLAVTADDGATAWATHTFKTLALTAPYTVTAGGLFYVGLMVAAATVPTFYGRALPGLPAGAQAPLVTAIDTVNTGLTTPATAPATATGSAGTAVPYVQIS